MLLLLLLALDSRSSCDRRSLSRLLLRPEVIEVEAAPAAAALGCVAIEGSGGGFGPMADDEEEETLLAVALCGGAGAGGLTGRGKGM